MKAKAAVFMGANKPFEIREFTVTEPPAGYGRMELIASGVCGTDVHIRKGRIACGSPAVIGHEFVGKIDAINEKPGEDHGLSVGDNVIADIAVPCGKCPLCLAGDDANCVNFSVTNAGSIDEPPYMLGGYSEVNFTPLSNLIKIPENVDPTVAAVFACAGPTCFHSFALAKRANIAVGDVNTAVVQGLGAIGMFALMYLKRAGVKKVITIGARKNERREKLALSLGADKVYTIATDGIENIENELSGENGGIGVDLVIEASGAPSAFFTGVNILRNRGVYLVPGQYSSSGSVALEPQMITLKALQILGSSQYSMSDVHEYVNFLAENPDLHEKIASLASKYTVSETNDAFEDAQTAENIKTLLVKRK